MLPLKVHNVLDYLTAVVLFLAPFALNFSGIEPARNVFMATGSLLMLYSLFTNYYFAAGRVIPLGVHMSLDTAIGIALMISPWIFNYRVEIGGWIEAFHYVVGVAILAHVAFTCEHNEEEKRRHRLQIELPLPH